MYINKVQSFFMNIVSGVGTVFWGLLFWIMIFGMLMDLSVGDFGFLQTSIPSITGGLGVFYVIHLFLRYLAEKVKIYNALFSNDANGILHVKVVARALGISVSKVIGQLNLLFRLHLLKNCELQVWGKEDMIVLSQNSQRGESVPELVTVVCSHCGGENKIRPGFVQACIYCQGSLEDGGKAYVSE